MRAFPAIWLSAVMITRALEPIGAASVDRLRTMLR